MVLSIRFAGEAILVDYRPLKRPYVITRAAYAGIQRYSTMWTGDTNSTWDALSLSLPMFQTLGLSGEAFVGADIGGFIDAGLKRQFPTQIVLGGALSVVMAVALDLLLLAIERALTPWRRTIRVALPITRPALVETTT